MTTTIHPPKHETFDLVARTNTDPKGVIRAVDEYRLCPWGLYMARPTPGRIQFHYLESWLLPAQGLRANVFHFNPGYERDQDHYLDLVVRTGRGTELVDVDELLEAQRIGLLSTEAAEQAVRTAVAAVGGLAAHGHDLHGWLAGTGVELSWRQA